MTFEEYREKFIEKATEAGFSEDNIQACLAYARPLLESGLPVIYNTTNLAAFVGYSRAYIKRAALFTKSYYRSFQIKKKNGTPRNLKEPLPSLKEIQIWILKNILEQVKVSKYAKAYIHKRNILDNAKYHKHKPIVLALDIKDFFDSINREHIESIFLNLKYSSNISNLLSKLCCCDDKLAQGAPTSPYLSNLYLAQFDEKVGLFCLSNQIRYTRYADDLTFSGDFEPSIVIEEVQRQIAFLKNNKLLLNTDKTEIMLSHMRQVVTGLVVNSKVIQVPRAYRDEIRKEVYFLEKYGLAEHLRQTNNRRRNYLKHLLGKINFVLHINKDDKKFLEYKTIVIKHYRLHSKPTSVD